MSVFLKSMILHKEWTWQIILLLTLHACPLVRFSEKFLAVVKYDFQRGKKYQKAQNAGQLVGELLKLKNAVQKPCKRLIWKCLMMQLVGQQDLETSFWKTVWSVLDMNQVAMMHVKVTLVVHSSVLLTVNQFWWEWRHGVTDVGSKVHQVFGRKSVIKRYSTGFIQCSTRIMFPTKNFDASSKWCHICNFLYHFFTCII